MVSHSERTQSTIRAILAAARLLFTREGFDGVSVDQIAESAGVAKGAVYHHFASKEAIFTRVLETVQEEIATRLASGGGGEARTTLDAVSTAVLGYLEAAMEPQNKRILLIDGPAILGWRKWREIDDRFFGTGARAAVARMLGPGASASEIAAIGHLFMGAVMEAALVCATSEQPERTAADLTGGLRRLLSGLLASPPPVTRKTSGHRSAKRARE